MSDVLPDPDSLIADKFAFEQLVRKFDPTRATYEIGTAGYHGTWVSFDSNTRADRFISFMNESGYEQHTAQKPEYLLGRYGVTVTWRPKT